VRCGGGRIEPPEQGEEERPWVESEEKQGRMRIARGGVSSGKGSDAQKKAERRPNKLQKEMALKGASLNRSRDRRSRLKGGIMNFVGVGKKQGTGGRSPLKKSFFCGARRSKKGAKGGKVWRQRQGVSSLTLERFFGAEFREVCTIWGGRVSRWILLVSSSRHESFCRAYWAGQGKEE